MNCPFAPVGCDCRITEGENDSDGSDRVAQALHVQNLRPPTPAELDAAELDRALIAPIHRAAARAWLGR